jgi:hypothetical protein
MFKWKKKLDTLFLFVTPLFFGMSIFAVFPNVFHTKIARSFIETTDRNSNSSPILINMTQKGVVNKRSPSNDPTDGTDHTRKLEKPNQPIFKCKAIKTYQTTQHDHLSFIQDDVIVVFNRKSRDLWVCVSFCILDSIQ